MRQLLSLISLIALVSAGSAVAQMPLDTTMRGYLQKPQTLTPARGVQRDGAHALLLIRTDPTAGTTVTTPVSTGAPSASATRYNFTGGEAEAYLTKYGYINVSSMRQDSSSVWRALAMHDGRQVEVAVDYQGNIFER